MSLTHSCVVRSLEILEKKTHPAKERSIQVWKGREPPSHQTTTWKFSWPFHTDTYVHASLNTLVSFFLPPFKHKCASAGWFFSGKSFYRTAAFGLNMQDSPSDRKNMANALAPVCEGRVSSGTGLFGGTLARHFGCTYESTQDERQLHFTDKQKYVLLKKSRMLQLRPL